MYRVLVLAALLAFNVCFAQTPFTNFTGKVAGNKVRLRTKPDLEGHVVKMLNKQDLLLVVGEEGDFYAVKPPQHTKAYIFRTYVIDNTIEASKVNVRLQPSADAPVIGQLLSGAKVTGDVSLHNNKWLEIAPPDNVQFYVSKEFVTNIGGPDYLLKMEKRKGEVENLLNSSFALAKEECQKPFEQMNPQLAIVQFEKIIQGYSDFEDEMQQAKEGLSALQDNYLKKKISYLEAHASEAPQVAEVVFPAVSATSTTTNDPNIWDRRNFSQKKNMTSKMRFWEQVEDTLFASWQSFHNDKSKSDFYREQKVNAISLAGELESFDPSLKNRPADYILKENGSPVAYVYSTQVDLEKCLGKKISIKATPRPNNHFAFPAYFVLEAE